MKRKIFIIATAVILFGITGSASTLSYFTDTSEVTNVFTVGNADIELFRWYSPISRYYNKEEAPGVNERYESWLSASSNMLVGGKSVAIYPYITNVGNIDVYVRFNVYFPQELFDGGYIAYQYGDHIKDYGSETEDTEFVRNFANVVIDGKKYKRLRFTRIKPLAPHQQTTNSIYKSLGLTQKAIVGDPDLSDFVDENGKLNVKITAEAVQAYGFNTAQAAFDFAKL